MPLSPPAGRRQVHSREIVCRAYYREDGLWDIDGHLTDIKTYDVPNRWRGLIPPGEPIHDMWIRLTIDDDLNLVEIEARTEKSPFAVCAAITEDFQKLVGVNVGPGWTRAVRSRLGGEKGCTHLVEMLRPLALTVYQAVSPRAKNPAAPPPPKQPRTTRPLHIGGCHALRADGPVVKEFWPEWYEGGAAD